jgi:hypothetical protein
MHGIPDRMYQLTPLISKDGDRFVVIMNHYTPLSPINSATCIRFQVHSLLVLFRFALLVLFLGFWFCHLTIFIYTLLVNSIDPSLKLEEY